MNKIDEWLKNYKNSDLLLDLVNEQLEDPEITIFPISSDLLDRLVEYRENKAKDTFITRMRDEFSKLENEGYSTISIEQVLKLLNRILQYDNVDNKE